MIVKVYTDDGRKRPVKLLATVVKEYEGIYHIKYLSPTDDMFEGKQIFKFEDEIYDIDDTSITEFLDELPGFRQIDQGYVKDDTESEYCPSEDSIGSESESYSYVNSDDEEYQESYDEYQEDPDDE
jgi:hypothetical protein